MKRQAALISEIKMRWYNFRRNIFTLHKDSKGIYAFRILGWFYDLRTFYYRPEEYEERGNGCQWYSLKVLLDGSVNLSEWRQVPWMWKNGRSFMNSYIYKGYRAMLWFLLGWFLRSSLIVMIVIGIGCSKPKPKEDSMSERWIEEIMLLRRTMTCFEFGGPDLCMCKSGPKETPYYFQQKCNVMKNMEIPTLRRSF